MKFEKITYTGLIKQVEQAELNSLEDVKSMLNDRFINDPDVARYEELKMENGKTAISLKDRGNKLIVQYKTI